MRCCRSSIPCWTLGWGRPLPCGEEGLVLTQGSPPGWGGRPRWHKPHRLTLRSIWERNGGSRARAQNVPRPGKRQLYWTAPLSSPPQPATHIHMAPPPWLTDFQPQKPPHLTHQAREGAGREGLLGSGAREEPSWLALGPLEGVTDVLPVCLSQGFGHAEWTLPSRRVRGQRTASFWSLDSLP